MKRFKRITYTLAELTDLELLPITVLSHTIEPNKWCYCKYLDGHFWPHSLLSKTKKRLEELRAEIRAERISFNEIIELQSLANKINKNDVELLQWASVEEN